MNGVVQFGKGTARTLRPHFNAGLEMVYIPKGNLRWQVEGKIEKVAPGTIFFSLPWQEHGGVEEFESGHLFHYVVFELGSQVSRSSKKFIFHPSLQFSKEESHRISSLLCSCQKHAFKASKALSFLMPVLVEELRFPKVDSNAMIPSLSRTAILELARLVEVEKNAGQLQDSSHPRVVNFLNQLTVRCQEPWTLEGMARACGLGRTRFTQICETQTGDAPMKYLNRIRVNRARELLRSSKRSVTAIAFDCGFESSQYFARIFKRFTNTTAKQYRTPSLKKS